MSVADLQKEIRELKAQLQKEREEREKLKKWMQDELASVKANSQHESGNANKISQITTWIRDNLGPNLEHVKKLIVESSAPSDSSKDIFTASSIGGIKEAPNSKEGKHLPTKKETTNNIFKTSEPANLFKSDSEKTKTRAPDFDKPIKEEDSYVSDEEWSSSDDEVEDRRNRVVPHNERLAQLETTYIPLPTRMTEDSSIVPTTARINIEHSVHLHSTLFKISTEELIPKLRNFNAKGGKILFVPLDRKKYPFSFGVKSADQLYPICPDGLIRSQILYLVLKGVKRSLGREKGVHLPHGTKAGYDASTGDMFVYKDDEPWLNKSFRAAFGQRQAARFGEKAGVKLHALGPTHINKNWKKESSHKQQMKEFFDLWYYRQPQKNNKTGKIVFITFGSSLIPTMDRLEEVNEGKLDNITVLAMPFENDIQISAEDPDLKKFNMTREQLSYRRHLEAFENYSSLFVPLKKDREEK